MEIKSLTKNQILEYFPKRDKDTNKGDYGVVTIFASSNNYVGAVKLATLGAISMRFGSGYTILGVTESVAKSISPEVFECTLSIQEEKNGMFFFNKNNVDKAIEKADVVAVGMGMGSNIETNKLVKYLLTKKDKGVIIDADGLNSITKEDIKESNHNNIIITPHPKELSRLIGNSVDEIVKNQVSIAINVAKELNVTILLKGSNSVITDGKEIYRVENSSPSLAKAGSGDFLSGAISSLAIKQRGTLSCYLASQIIGSVASEFSERYNDNVMLARDLCDGIKEYFKRN